MANTGFTVESFHRVYNDVTGDYIEVGPDCDSLGLTEIKVGDAKNGIVLPSEQLPKLIVALQKRLADIEAGAES